MSLRNLYYATAIAGSTATVILAIVSLAKMFM